MTVEVLNVTVAEVKYCKLKDNKERIFPIIKSTSWLSKSNGIIKTVDPENFLVTEETGNPDIQVSFALEYRETDSRSYISQKEMLSWGIGKQNMKELALSNLRTYIHKERGQGRNIFRHTQSGLVLCNQLNDFSPSLILLKEIADLIQLSNHKLVATVLRSDLLVLCSTGNKKGLCVLGELIQSQTRNCFPTKPFRITDGQMVTYNVSTDDEYAVPLDEKHLRRLKSEICRTKSERL